MTLTTRSDIDTTHELTGEKLFPPMRRIQRLWRNGEIDEIDRPRMQTKLPQAMVCGITAGLLGWFAVGTGLTDFASWAVMVFAALIALTGAGELWRTIRHSPSHLALERETYQPGEILRGALHGPRGLSACEQITVCLQHLAQVTVYPQPSLGARRDAPETITLEIHNTTAKIDRNTFVDKVIPLPLAIEMPIPTDLGAATDASPEWTYVWRLSITAKTPSRNYASEFILPVFAEALQFRQ
jgi:hypothetical protein